MGNFKKAHLILILMPLFVHVRGADGIAGQRIKMDNHWKFLKGDIPGAEKPDYNDINWRDIQLPHDWSIEGEFSEDAPTGGPGGYLPAGIGWYRKKFTLPVTGKEMRYRIEFDGVYMNSDVWINGIHLGKHPFGYTSFWHDLTPYIRKGTNLIAVRVDNSLQPNSRWYSGSGIYRHVWLNITGQVHVAQWGTCVTTPEADSAKAEVSVRTSIENHLSEKQNVTLRSVIIDTSGREIASAETAVRINATGKTEVGQVITVKNPLLWSPDLPVMYTLKTFISGGARTLDQYSTPFGIRRIEFDKDKGFLLNGKRVKMNGVCLHHDAGCLGAAVPVQAWTRRLQLLKEMGCNAIRTSHNPPAPEFLDLCDNMGFLVMDEIFDEWVEKKNRIAYGYHFFFKDWWEADVVSMIRRDHNHPSVVIWSAGNEVPDQVKETGIEVMRRMVETIHREDPTRPVTQANDRIAAGDGPAKLQFLELQDIVGYNYVDRWSSRRELYYSIDRHDHPDWKMIGTENASNSSIRGNYLLPSEQSLNQGFRGDYRKSMIRAEQLWRFTSIHDYVIGDFMWTGIDYLGEASWPAKNASSGVIDLCGFPKDGYYFYQSQWSEKPMVHLFPHWNWTGHEGEIISVIAYSNCDTVELFLNGKSFGSKSSNFPQQGFSKRYGRYDQPFVAPTTSDLHLSWDVPYEPGTLKAVGRKDGKVITEEVRTTSAPASIRLVADKTVLSPDGNDIVHVRIEIADKNGWIVPDAANPVEFSLNGEGMLAGTDNGNPQDRTSMKSNRRNTFNGLALAIIRSTVKEGKIYLRATSPGLTAGNLELTSGSPAITGPEKPGKN